MTIPAGVERELAARFGRLGSVHPFGGGCIHAAAKVTTAAGPIFVKYGGAAPGMFAVEAAGLGWLGAQAASLRLPAVLAAAEGWLALEWLEPAAADGRSGERLGRGLAALHRAPCAGWGWERDGWIGTLPQDNRPTAAWADFWRERRLEPQLRRAAELGRRPGRPAEWERLLAALPDLLAVGDAEGPSPLHGDLWSGNILTTTAGEAALVDPAPFRGHREVDLAMAELFGGFPARWEAAYQEVAPLRPGYREVRRAVYQLYFLLVHVNLFGAAYAARTADALRTALAHA